jgi:WXXGXW repeat (2 copies)
VLGDVRGILATFDGISDAARELLASKKHLSPAEHLSHPDRTRERRAFRYGHLIGPPPSRRQTLMTRPASQPAPLRYRGPTECLPLGMTNWKLGLVGLALSSLGLSALVAPKAQATVVIIHGGWDEPPPVREEHVMVRRGYVWDRGHYRWRHHHYVWTRGRYVRERSGYEWVPGRWERHEDHYDWHDGEWHPQR